MFQVWTIGPQKLMIFNNYYNFLKVERRAVPEVRRDAGAGPENGAAAGGERHQLDQLFFRSHGVYLQSKDFEIDLVKD